MLFAVFEYKGLWLDNIEGDWKIPTSIPSDGISDGTEHWVIIPRVSRNFALSLWRDWCDLREWKPRTLHADVPTLTAHRSSFCHAELVSASVSGDVLEMARSGILKQVQDDHQLCSVVLCSYVTSHRSQLIAHNSKICRICVICVP